MLIVTNQETSLLRTPQQTVPRSSNALHVQRRAKTGSPNVNGQRQIQRTRNPQLIVARATKAGTGTAILAAPFAIGGAEVFVAGGALFGTWTYLAF